MLELRNKFIMAPIKLGYTKGDGKVTKKHLDFYQQRSEFMGAIALEPLYMDAGLREIPTQLGIDNDDKIEGLSELVSTIHEGGAKVIAHLNHPGRMANPKLPDNYYLSSTDKACESGGKPPKRMEGDDFENVINIFIDSAKRAEKSGFDIIELQFGHGYLMAQFLSSFVNDREDEYGGSFENRAKFPLEVFEKVKNSVNIPVIVRISGDEMFPNGIKSDETVKFAKLLEARGVSAIHVLAGSVCSTPPWFFQHMFIKKGKTWDLAREIKKNVNIPVIFVGRINEYSDIETLTNEYNADYIAIGRALVADSSFIGKYLGKVKGNYRPCLACAEGCLGGVKSGKGLGCLVNPEVIKEKEVEEKAETPKNYAVVGGGLTGMDMALRLYNKGNAVKLYEKDELGGQFNLAYLPPNKKNLSRLVNFYKEELKEKKIEIIKKEVGAGELLSGEYDGVFLATGSKPFIPKIKGLKDYHWAEVLREENSIRDKKVLVIGGGLIGIEVGLALLKRNNRIIIVEMLEDVGRGMEMIERKLVLKALKEGGAEIYVNAAVEEINENSVFVKMNGELTEFKNIDEIILTTGMKPYNQLEDELRGKIPVFVIGDAKKVGNAQSAIADSFETVKTV